MNSKYSVSTRAGEAVEKAFDEAAVDNGMHRFSKYVSKISIHR